jgi:hypothetical protein
MLCGFLHRKSAVAVAPAACPERSRRVPPAVARAGSPASVLGLLGWEGILPSLSPVAENFLAANVTLMTNQGVRGTAPTWFSNESSFTAPNVLTVADSQQYKCRLGFVCPTAPDTFLTALR